jgi:hypothetical protein
MLTESLEINYSAWSEWNPKDYLSEYYAEVMPDERYALEFLVESLRKLPPITTALDFGSGPTVHHLFALVPKVQEIHAAEYLPANREEVRRWLAKDDQAHDWNAFAYETLALEGNLQPSPVDIAAREDETRQRTTSIWAADAGERDPLGPEKRGYYPLVTTHYCAEGATHDKDTWRLYMENIVSLVRPGGTLILSACGAADFYCVGTRLFPCAGVTAEEIISCLHANGFRNLDVRIRSVPDHSEQGYSSVIFVCAVKGNAY